jgi:hypothetical protein
VADVDHALRVAGPRPASLYPFVCEEHQHNAPGGGHRRLTSDDASATVAELQRVLMVLA